MQPVFLESYYTTKPFFEKLFRTRQYSQKLYKESKVVLPMAKYAMSSAILNRKTYQRPRRAVLYRKKIGAVPGSALGLTGYELQITGGSDGSGFPMLGYVEGAARKSLLMSRGLGAREIKKPGIRRRKTVAGNTVSVSTAQVNLKVTKAGTKSVPELLGIQPKEEAKAETTAAPPAEQKAETKPKKEEKKEAKKE